jgi:2-(1,2-epoxy-1,2-dihydrophenyl)acetyl-CoA isomerase
MGGATATTKLRTSIEDGVGVITLCDPATLNAADMDLMAELKTAFEAMIADAAVRAIVLTGEGRGFCSGANLSGGGGERGAMDGPNRALLDVYNPFLDQMRRSPKPTVAAVNGAAAGIGVSLALVCDLIVAAESAYFLQAFRRIGLVPDGGATYLLPRLVGKARAMELMMLGEKLPARTALEWGLINRCVSDTEVMPAAMEIARTLAQGPKSLGYIRTLVWDSLDAQWTEQLEAEAHVQGEAGRTEDAREGVLAFLQKRPATFRGA